MKAATRASRHDSRRDWRDELALHAAVALGAGLAAGVIAAATVLARNGYLEQQLHLLSWDVLARAVRRACLGATALVAAGWGVAALATGLRVRPLAAPAASLGVLLATIAAARYDVADALWIQTWEPWAAAALVSLVALRPYGPRVPRRAAALVALVALVLVVGPSVVSSVLEARARAALASAGRPNVILLLVDALRADHVGVYGYPRPTTPTLDALATRGVRFAHAVSPSNKTRTAMPSLWSGLYPSRHGVFGVTDLVPQSLTTAAELLRNAGYRTAAYCPNPNLDRSVGHAQGWQHYDDRSLQPDRSRGPKWAQFETASRIHERFLRWLDRDAEAPFLAWLHYRDVHGPYVPPPPYDTMFDSPGERPLTPEEVARRKRYLNLENDGNDLLYYIDRYDGGIRYTDDRIADLLAALAARGLQERTVLLVTADHGETFLDHGFWDHGDTLHQEQIHVPLIATGPGIAPGHVVGEPVSTLDLFATVLGLAGLDAPANDGFSLLPHLAGEAAVRRPGPLFAEAETPRGVRQWAVRRGSWKLLGEWGEAGALFDLERDPRESTDRTSDEPLVAAALRGDWQAFAGVAPEPGPVPTEQEIDPRMREQLEALGYVEPPPLP